MSKAIVSMLAAAMLLAGCGGGDEKAPVNQQTKAELTRIDEGLSKKLNPIFAALKKRKPEAQVVPGVRAQVKKFATAEVAAARELQSVRAPDDVKPDVAKWATGLRQSAAVLKRTVGEKDLSGQRLVETIIANGPPAVAELQKKGYLPAPPPQ